MASAAQVVAKATGDIDALADAQFAYAKSQHRRTLASYSDAQVAQMGIGSAVTVSQSGGSQSFSAGAVLHR